jgi:hypothetical protein
MRVLMRKGCSFVLPFVQEHLDLSFLMTTLGFHTTANQPAVRRTTAFDTLGSHLPLAAVANAVWS